MIDPHDPAHRRGESRMLNRLTTTVDFQSQALLLRSERQRVLASNIANADTPGYQARDFNFKAALADATGGARAAAANQLGAPIARGASGLSTAPGERNPALTYATPSQTNLDGNTVDMDRERASFADNAVRYEATLRFINGSLRTLQDAMKSHTQG
jgi:flagellar basal-body rod protein FlgB